MSAKTQRNIVAWQFCTTCASLPPTPWRSFGGYFGKNVTYAKGLQWLKLWEMIVHRLKLATCKVLEVYWIFVRFNKIFMGSVFLLSLFHNRLQKQGKLIYNCYPLYTALLSDSRWIGNSINHSSTTVSVSPSCLSAHYCKHPIQRIQLVEVDWESDNKDLSEKGLY